MQAANQPPKPRSHPPEAVPDPRDRRGVRYSLAGVLAPAATATVAGCRSFAAIGQWAARPQPTSWPCFGLASGSAPEESTLRKPFAPIDADALDGAWVCGCGRGPSPSTSAV